MSRGPGSFFVYNDSELYIGDSAHSNIKCVNLEDGSEGILDLPMSNAVFDDLVADLEWVYWFSEGNSGISIWRTAKDPEAKQGANLLTRIREPEFLMQNSKVLGRPFRTHGLCRLFFIDGSLHLVNLYSGFNVPIILDDEVVTSGQRASLIDSSFKISSEVTLDVAGSGEEKKHVFTSTAGRRKEIHPAGRIYGWDDLGNIAVSRTEFTGNLGWYFLDVHHVDKAEVVVSFLKVTRWSWGRAAVPTTFRMSASGSIYELHFDPKGVYLSRWDFNQSQEE